ncbi:MAG: PASTA domain-containing protein [Bacteroidia bacterium]|nr:PASTA domain-containing protein [Bacteroidia bacterium]
MFRIRPYSIGLLLALCVLISSCSTPKILFTVSEGKEVVAKKDQISITRNGQELLAEKDMKFEEGDLLQISEGIDGTAFRSFQTVSTAHGNASLLLTKAYLEQQSGTVLHVAKKGKLLLPGMSVSTEGASYLVNIEENTLELIVFNGRILVSSTELNPPWPPFEVNARQKRKIWTKRGLLAPNQPMTPLALNSWIDTENQLLKAGNSSQRMVPSVISLPGTDAKGLIESAEFPVTHTFTKDEEGELGTISKQEPLAGKRIAANKEVKIFENSRPVIVPSVFGLSFGAAKDSLQKLGLVGVEAGKSITGSVQPSFINSQKPAANEQAAFGSKVELTIEAVSVEVPSLVGKSEEEARRILGELKLEIDSSKYALDYSGPPMVISQTPEESRKVTPASVVKVVLQAKGFQVPKVVDMTETNATQTLVEAGFSLGESVYKKSDKKEGLVIGQSPTANSLSGKDVKVVLTISKGN